MTDREKIKRYFRKKMGQIVDPDRILKGKKLSETTFAFCWGQAKFDTLMDIDIELKLGAFYKKQKGERNEYSQVRKKQG